MGVVNLFADTTDEGGAGVHGPFLATLGASAAAVGIIAGVGEFLGYSLRSVSGYMADKTGTHWAITFVGYFINLLAVPAMALAPSSAIGGASRSPGGLRARQPRVAGLPLSGESSLYLRVKAGQGGAAAEPGSDLSLQRPLSHGHRRWQTATHQSQEVPEQHGPAGI